MKVNNYIECINILIALKKAFPSVSLGRHISTALDGTDPWNISDRNLFLALEKYNAEMGYDVPHTDSVEDIITKGMHLERMFEEEE